MVKVDFERMTTISQPLADHSLDPPVRGLLHSPPSPAGAGLVLTHGAGGDCRAPVLVAVAEACAAGGVTVLRCDLPFRQTRPSGPPRPAEAARDRAGLAQAVSVLARLVGGPVCLGGHSYGGRQATMLAAEQPGLVQSLLVLSYPLHPLRRSTELRTGHFTQLRTPAMFVHGSRDPFGSLEQLREALRLISGPTVLMAVDGAGHELLGHGRVSATDRVDEIARRFVAFVATGGSGPK